MSIDLFDYQPVDDKKNSDFFNEYRLKIYQRRQSIDLEDLLQELCAVVVRVETGDTLSYLEELCLMTPYRFCAAYLNETHKIYIMESRPGWPRYIILEPVSTLFVL